MPGRSILRPQSRANENPIPMPVASRILIVEDEADLVDIISFNLTKAGYTTLQAFNGAEGLDLAMREHPDLLLLDLMLPKLGGMDVARRLRAEPATASIPIIMLTAKAEELDQLDGLTVGADDYITKPFSIPVLLARIEAVLRRTSPKDGASVIALAGVSVNLDTYDVTVDDEPIQLTATEFKLLASLLQAGGRVLTRHELISRAMGAGVRITDRAVDVHLAAVRKKLGSQGKLINTVRSVGYQMCE
jgi:DNA-binding response OmpR family regulator